MSLECRNLDCHHQAVNGGYCAECEAERQRVLRDGGTIDGVPVAPRAGSVQVADPVVESSEHRFGLKKFGRGYVWTREASVAAVQEYVETVGRAPTLADAKREPVGQLPSAASVERLFGSWDALLARAEAAPATHPAGARRPWTRDEIVDAIRRYAEEQGRPPVADDWIQPPEGFPARSTVFKHFGTWRAAIHAAGFEAGRPGPKKTPEKVAAPVADGHVEVPVDLIVELVGCTHEIEKHETALAAARGRYHELLAQLHAAV